MSLAAVRDAKVYWTKAPLPGAVLRTRKTRRTAPSNQEANWSGTGFTRLASAAAAAHQSNLAAFQAYM